MDATRYGAPPRGALRLEPLDALTAAFHRPSRATHLLAAPAPEMLAMLDAHGPLTAAELLERLSLAFEIADADAHVVAARLRELAAAGLVEPR